MALNFQSILQMLMGGGEAAAGAATGNPLLMAQGAQTGLGGISSATQQPGQGGAAGPPSPGGMGAMGAISGGAGQGAQAIGAGLQSGALPGLLSSLGGGRQAPQMSPINQGVGKATPFQSSQVPSAGGMGAGMGGGAGGMGGGGGSILDLIKMLFSGGGMH